MKTKLSIFSLLMVLSQVLSAQITPGFNFQAVARNADGEPIKDKSIDVLVGIRSGSANGSLIWEEAHTTTTNEFGLFTLEICGNNDLRTGGSAAAVDNIDWASDNHFIDLKVDAGQGMVALGATRLLSVPYSMVTSTYPNTVAGMSVQPRSPVEQGEALFMVKREDGYPVFAVYEDGVWVYTDDDATGKGIKGGFAVGGYNTANKAPASEYFMVSPDSARIYVNSYEGKGIKGGFAVGGYNTANKGNVDEFLRVTRDSTRVYVNTLPAKGIKGGFAVGGINTSNKAGSGDFMSLQRDNYFIGHNSGAKVTTGLYNSIMGYESGINITTGESNAFLGYQAGYLNDIGSGNLFLGYQSGYINTFGNYNTFLGYQAGHLNWGGTNNTFLGSFSGHNNAGGSYNTIVGDSAGYHNTYGVHNTFLGTKSGLTNIDGSSNVFLGDHSGLKNENGSENVFIGRNSGYSNVHTARNVFIGTQAGYMHVEDWDNIFIGTYAGYSHEQGAGNVFLGYEAGRNTVKGTRNVFLGNTAGYNEKGSNKLYISNWDSDSSGTLIWGDFQAQKLRMNANVGIGMNPSWETLSLYNPVGAGALSIFGEGDPYNYSVLTFKSDTAGVDKNYSFGHSLNHDLSLTYYDGAGGFFERLKISESGIVGIKANVDIIGVTTMNGNVGIGAPPDYPNLLVNDAAGIGNLAIRGVGDDYNYAALVLESSGQSKVKSYALNHGKNNAFALIYFDGVNYFPRMQMDTLGHMTLNNWEMGTEILDVNGNARFRGVPSGAGNDLLITANGELRFSASDARLKSDFQPLKNSLERVLKMEGYTFTWKAEEAQSRDVGLIAQDVAGIFPEAVFENPGDGYLGINYSRFPALFVEAFKEQQAIIDDQKEEIDDLKVRLEKLEKLVNSK